MTQMREGVLDHGYVELIDNKAHDIDVVNAARVSFGRTSKSMAESDEKLIGFLMKNRHGTPFEHNYMKFQVRAPIFVFREWHRHRIGVSINEVSGRYKELETVFYLPTGRVRTQTGKPGHYKFETASADKEREALGMMIGVYDRAKAAYRELLELGVAKEIARCVLPVATYSEMHWTCNARSLMSFLSLRNSKHAQREIREYAEQMEKMFSKVMPITHKAFVDCGRVAP